MSRIVLPGLDGSNPLGFLAALGLLRIVPSTKLGFSTDGSFEAFINGFQKSKSDLAALVALDAASSNEPWRFCYIKAATKKQGAREVADLKPPPDAFRRFLGACIESWLVGEEEPAAYAAAYATDVAVDGKGNTKPTAFHFTAAQQTFLGAVDCIRASVDERWVSSSLFDRNGKQSGSNLRWDPGAERNWALMANDPSKEGTQVDAPLEWLAFRGLPLLPSFPQGKRIITTAVSGLGDDMTFTWPLWSIPASLDTVRSAIQLDWSRKVTDHSTRGVFAICSSGIRRTSQGFGNFTPSSISC